MFFLVDDSGCDWTNSTVQFGDCCYRQHLKFSYTMVTKNIYGLLCL